MISHFCMILQVFQQMTSSYKRRKKNCKSVTLSNLQGLFPFHCVTILLKYPYPAEPGYILLKTVYIQISCRNQLFRIRTLIHSAFIQRMNQACKFIQQNNGSEPYLKLFYKKSCVHDFFLSIEGLTVRMQVRPDILSGLIWVQSVCTSKLRVREEWNLHRFR